MSRRTVNFRSLILLALLAALAGSIGALFARKPHRGAETDFGKQAQVILTERTIRHIQERHWPDSPAQGAGKYAPGITVDALRDLINETVANGKSRSNTNGRPGLIYEYHFRRAIGTTIDGGPSTRLRVVVSPKNEVVTAFPI